MQVLLVASIDDPGAAADLDGYAAAVIQIRLTRSFGRASPGTGGLGPERATADALPTFGGGV